MSTPFDQANALWFQQGRTQAALSLYRAALAVQPESAVVAYQTARALWATGHADEARAAMARAVSHEQQASKSGRLLLRHWQRTLRGTPSTTPQDVSDLDADCPAPSKAAGHWLSAGRRALAAGIYGFAVLSLERAEQTRDTLRDLREAESRRDVEWGALREMMASKVNTESNSTVWLVDVPLVGGSGAKPQPPAADSRLAPSGRTRPASKPAESLPEIPLQLVAWAEPNPSPAQSSLDLVIELRNPGDRAVVFNRRMLIHHLPHLGEILLRVNGPAGYQNRAGFQVRAGTPSAEHAARLEPGQSYAKRYELRHYESFDRPGSYDVHVTYQNRYKLSLQGQAALVGAVDTSLRVERT